MKYFLSLKTYAFYRKREELTEIKGFLPEPNCYTLKDICQFTMQFQNTKSLKEYLLKQDLIKSLDLNKDIVITYNYRGIRKLKVPYKSDEQYFSMTNLAEIISKEIKSNPNFMEYLRSRDIMPEIYYNLRFNAWKNNSCDNVMRFICAMCYDKEVFRFKAFYDIAMTVANIYNLKELNTITKPVEEKVSATNLSEVVECEKEYLLERKKRLEENNKGQMSLFDT